MPEANSELDSSQIFRDRAINILAGKCLECAFAKGVLNRAGYDDGCIYEAEPAFLRLGGFIGGVTKAINPAPCNGVNCLTTEQVIQLEDLRRGSQLPSDPAFREPMVELAVEAGILNIEPAS